MLILLLNFNPYPFKHEDISDFIRSAQRSVAGARAEKDVQQHLQALVSVLV